MENPASFVRWLHAACLADPDKVRPYSRIYELGPHIETAIGMDGDFKHDLLVAMIRETFSAAEAAELVEQLLHAEASWRMDTLDFDSEAEILTPELVVPCTHTGLDGNKCKKSAVPGASRCVEHGGTVLDPAVRQSMLIIAYAKMMDGSAKAVDALVDVAEYSNNDLARVQAAREILDRVGLVYEEGRSTAPAEFVSPEETQADELDSLREHLDSARGRLQLVAVPTTSTEKDDNITDAEIVETSEPEDG